MERVEFSLGFSRALLLTFLILHLGSGLILLYLPIPIILQCAGVTLMVLHGWQVLKLHVFRVHPNATVKIWQDHNGKWGCETSRGHRAIGSIEGQSHITQYFMMLSFRFKTRSQNVIVPMDAVTTHQYRVLATRLKFFC